MILDSGNSVVKNLSTSRQGFLPAYDPDSCVHCGICDIVCPDLCFVWSDDGDDEHAVRLLGIDYHYCKGCLKCIDACPTGSLTELREEDGWAEENRVPLFPWLERRKRGRPDDRRTAEPRAGSAPAQVVGFRTGNEMAALSAKQIDFHLMGYYPITPSTEIAELLDEMKAAGEHDIMMVPADGEHGAAGICYGATTGGGRVFNATSSQGLLYSLEQLPVQSGTRLPDAARPRDARGERAARHPRRPLRRLLRAEHRLADLHGARPAGRLRHEPHRAARRRARRRAAARDRGLRRLLHQPPEAPRLAASRTTPPCRTGSARCRRW